MKQESRKIYPFRVFTFLILAFLLGVLLSSYLNLEFQKIWPIMLITFSALFLTALFNFLYKNKLFVMINWIIIAIILGTVYYSYYCQRSNVNMIYDKELIIEGQIVKKVDRDYNKQKITIKITSTDGKNDLSNINILMHAPHYPEYHYGDIVQVKGAILQPKKIDDFDYDIYLRRHFIYGVIFRPSDIQKIAENSSMKVRILKSLYGFSEKMESSLNKSLIEPHSSLASGLILGVKRNIPKELMDDLNRVGLTHIIALSGYNVTIITSALSIVLLQVLGRKKTFWFGFILVSMFVILTGASSSVVRAAIFSFLIVFAKTIGRQGDKINLMLFAALVMVIVNPYVLRDDLSFQLSFIAFSGLIFISPVLEKIFNSKFKKIPDFIIMPLRETLSAQIAVAPLVLFTFNRISLISPISNMLVLGVIPIAMAMVFSAGILGIIFYPLGRVAGVIAWPILQYIIKITEMLSKIPLASVSLQSYAKEISLSLYSIIIVCLIIFIKRYKVKY